MQYSHLLTFNLALLAALVSPGPGFLVSVQTSLASGRLAGIAVGFGLAVSAAFWTAAALFGLDMMFAAFPLAYGAVKTIGALYLLYTAWGMWRGANRPLAGDVKPARNAFGQGMFVNMLNPKPILFAAAILAAIFPVQMTLAENTLIVVNQLIVEIVFYSCVACGMSLQSVRNYYAAVKSNIDRGAAAVLSLFGLHLLFDR